MFKAVNKFYHVEEYTRGIQCVNSMYGHCRSYDSKCTPGGKIDLEFWARMNNRPNWSSSTIPCNYLKIIPYPNVCYIGCITPFSDSSWVDVLKKIFKDNPKSFNKAKREVHRVMHEVFRY